MRLVLTVFIACSGLDAPLEMTAEVRPPPDACASVAPHAATDPTIRDS